MLRANWHVEVVATTSRFKKTGQFSNSVLYLSISHFNFNSPHVQCSDFSSDCEEPVFAATRYADSACPSGTQTDEEWEACWDPCSAYNANGVTYSQWGDDHNYCMPSCPSGESLRRLYKNTHFSVPVSLSAVQTSCDAVASLRVSLLSYISVFDFLKSLFFLLYRHRCIRDQKRR
jgi:hypothetical protein